MVTTNKLTTRAASVFRLGVILSIAHVTSSSLRSDDCVVLCCRRNRQIHVFTYSKARFIDFLPLTQGVLLLLSIHGRHILFPISNMNALLLSFSLVFAESTHSGC